MGASECTTARPAPSAASRFRERAACRAGGRGAQRLQRSFTQCRCEISEVITVDKITHPYVPTLLDQLAGGKIGRREFLRKSTLLGLSAASAYAMAGLADPFARARAEDKPKGGGLRIGMRCMEIKDPHLADFAERSTAAPSQPTTWSGI